jgi:hypothetical protein
VCRPLPCAPEPASPLPCAPICFKQFDTLLNHIFLLLQ